MSKHEQVQDAQGPDEKQFCVLETHSVFQSIKTGTYNRHPERMWKYSLYWSGTTHGKAILFANGKRKCVLLLQPATVSRCGMIYLEPSQLGWEPIVASWLNSLKEPLNELEHQNLLKELFNWLVQPSLEFRRKKCKVTAQ